MSTIQKKTEDSSLNQKTKVKKLLPAVVIATSFYYSYLFTAGLLLGYIVSKIYCKKFGIDEENGEERKIFIDMGKWQIHMHHWIMGAIVLLVAWIVDYFYLPMFFAGLVCGVMAHDIYDFNYWHQVLIKKEENK